jgi:hypothetical protein
MVAQVNPRHRQELGNATFVENKNGSNLVKAVTVEAPNQRLGLQTRSDISPQKSLRSNEKSVHTGLSYDSESPKTESSESSEESTQENLSEAPETLKVKKLKTEVPESGKIEDLKLPERPSVTAKSPATTKSLRSLDDRTSINTGRTFADGKVLHLVQAKTVAHKTKDGKLLMPTKGVITVISKDGVLIPIK